MPSTTSCTATDAAAATDHDEHPVVVAAAVSMVTLRLDDSSLKTAELIAYDDRWLKW